MLELRLLGEMQVRLDGAEVSVASGRQRLLLARLALAEGRFVPASQLIDEIWEDRPPGSATNALQVYISGLRKLLGPAAVRTSGRAYALDDAAAVDVMRFREEVSAGLRAAGAAAASDWLDRGLSRWAGLPCTDLDEVGFVSTARTGLIDLYLSAVEVRAALRIGQGAAAQVLPELRALAREHPFREGIHAQLILALAASGRQVEALAVFDNVRDQLAEEFGVDPGQALRGAQTAVLRSDLPVYLPVAADQSALGCPAQPAGGADQFRGPPAGDGRCRRFAGHGAAGDDDRPWRVRKDAPGPQCRRGGAGPVPRWRLADRAERQH